MSPCLFFIPVYRVPLLAPVFENIGWFRLSGLLYPYLDEISVFKDITFLLTTIFDSSPFNMLFPFISVATGECCSDSYSSSLILLFSRGFVNLICFDVFSSLLLRY